jgi:DTW domain-containing protein YfiP
MTQPPIAEEPATCPACGRTERYCVCEFVTPINTKTKILILQHPQEPGVDIGTVPIIQAAFPSSTVRTGLSWANLKKILGPTAEHPRWGVLYLGSVHVEDLPPGRTLFVVDKKGTPREDQDDVLRRLEGFVVLDGTWSQAKTLWWRNAWLLKLPRLVLNPSKRSVYDAIRKEPRKGCLSTAETVAEVLATLENRSDVREGIEKPLSELVMRLSKHKPRGSGLRRPGRYRRR